MFNAMYIEKAVKAEDLKQYFNTRQLRRITYNIFPIVLKGNQKFISRQ